MLTAVSALFALVTTAMDAQVPCEYTGFRAEITYTCQAGTPNTLNVYDEPFSASHGIESQQPQEATTICYPPGTPGRLAGCAYKPAGWGAQPIVFELGPIDFHKTYRISDYNGFIFNCTFTTVIYDGTLPPVTTTTLIPTGSYPNSDDIFATYRPIARESMKPKVTVTLLKSGIDAATGRRIVQGRLDYDMGDALSGWNIQAELLPWTNADGQSGGGETVLAPEAPLERVGSRTFTFVAPSGAQQVAVQGAASSCAGRGTYDASIDCGCDGTQDPVYFADGNVRVTDVDPLPPIASESLVRSYNSDEQVVALFGRGWTTLFDRRMTVYSDGFEQVVSIVTDTNEVVTFRETSGTYRQTWPTSRQVLGTLIYDSVSATYRHRPAAASEEAVFRQSDGRLVALRDSTTGREALIAYDANGLPQTLTDSWSGTSWNLTIDANRRISSIVVGDRPDLAWTYSYDAAGNLTTVLAPGNFVWRTYEYAANRMTASRDGVGNLIESHTYDANGYGSSSTGPGDEIATIEYDLPGATADERVTRLTYNNGATAEYTLRAKGGAWRPIHVSGGCASCGGGDTTFVHDAEGRPILEQAADGYVTRTTYTTGRVHSEEVALKPVGCDPQTDPQQCRLGPDALANASLEPTSATVLTTYEFADPLWPDRSTATMRPSVRMPGQFRREEYAYHPVTGEAVNTTVRGWTGQAPTEQDRVARTVLYGDVPPCEEPCPPYDPYAPAFSPGGSFQNAWLSIPQPLYVPRSIDGPRTDVEDVSAFVYYPVHSSVPALLRGRLAATKNTAGHVTRYEDYDVFGNVTRVVGPNDVATEITYDLLARTAATTTKGVPSCDTGADALCATDLTITQTYSSSTGPLLRQERAGGGVTSYAYDARGRMQTVSRGPVVGDLRERIETSYDALTGKKSLERTLAFEGMAWVEKTRQAFAYDARSRLQTITHADGAAVHYAYDAADRVATIRDENHAAPNTSYSYDPAGRVARVARTLAGAPNGVITTQYGYDNAGNLISVTDPNGNVTTYAYDDFGQMLTQQSPVTGTTTYTYDIGGNLIQIIDANGSSTNRTYDASNRILTGISSRGGQTETVTWTYDNADAGAYGLGRLAVMEDPSGVTSYLYERRGLLRKESHTIQGTTYLQTYGYDVNGNRTTIGYPSGRVVTYGFDDAGRPLTATGMFGGQATTYVTSAAYLPFGPLTSLALGNGTVETRTYNVRYLPVTNSLTAGATTLAQYTYTTDAAGNITTIADSTDGAYSRTFGYDDLSRLTTANTGGALWGSGSFSYDPMGNMLSATLGSQVRTFTYQGTTPRINAATNLASAMSYDAAGNELRSPAGEPGDGGVAAIYSPRNLLQSQFVREYDRCRELYSNCVEADPVQVWLSHSYDGRGVRITSVETIVAGTIDINDPPPEWNVYFYTPELTMLNVASRSTGRKADVIWFGARPIADQDGSTVRFTFTDHLGTPILQTSPSAAIIWRVEYEPFGNIRSLRVGSAADDQPLRFLGQQVVFGTGTGDEIYNIFRWYRPGWGRYTQPDPIGLRGGLNLYSYVKGSPVFRTDPTGLITKCPCGEKITMLVAVGPVNAYKGKELADEAFATTDALSLPGSWNGPKDAFRHCYWSCRMQQVLGAPFAEKVGTIHEDCSNNEPGELKMDLHNNAVGRSFGFAGINCEKLCLSALDGGKLQKAPAGTPPEDIY